MPMHPRDDPTRRCLPVVAWPAQDQLRWRAALRTGKRLVDPPGLGAKWAPETAEKHRKGYGRWLTFAGRNALIGPADDPGARVTPEAVEAYHAEIEAQVSSYTVRGRFQELYHAIRVMCPERDWAWLRERLRRIDAHPLAGRNKRARMIPAGEIVHWATGEIEAILDAGPPTETRAVRLRDALLLAALLSCPLRRGNMAAIELGGQLEHREDGYQLAFEARETKNRAPFEAYFPTLLTPWLDAWIERYRPVLLDGKEFTDRLWINRYGNPMSGMAVYHRVIATTERAFGHSINPHLVRDIAATAIALLAPERVRITRDILGHLDHRSGERHYNQAGSIDASRAYNQVLSDERRKGLPPEAYTAERPGG